MKFFVLSFNGECRILRCNPRAPMAEINNAAFGVPYGPKSLGCERALPPAMARAREAGFSEVIVDGKKVSLEMEGVSGVV